jgi:penicillin amidase
MSAVRRLGIAVLALVAAIIVAVAAFALWVYAGVVATSAEQTGSLGGAGVSAPVTIARDARGIPHIRAANERDAFYAQGYAEGSDRLFQLDVYRRAVTGRLSEIFGPKLLDYDERAREFDPEEAVARQERSLSPAERADLVAFAAGVQKAIDTRPLPPEFRFLGYRPEPWRARDALLVAFATVVALADPWDDIVTRDDVRRAGGDALRDAFYPVTDPAYDVPLGGAKPAPVPSLPPLHVRDASAAPLFTLGGTPDHGEVGSNDFTAGAQLTATRRALLANDPHLALRIPGVWYLVDMSAPGYHVAGATLAGVPGVILGHNEHLAWGVTNGTVATTRVYRETFQSPDSDLYRAGGAWLHATHRRERFNVRFGKTVERDYLATRHGFVFGPARGNVRYAAAWTGVTDGRSGFATYASLGRARDTNAGLAALASYPGPPQNFVLADDGGRAAYALAGDVWRDPLWARAALDGPSSAAPGADYVPFAALPKVAPSRATLAFTANNRMYGAAYPLRLTPFFEAPYRAARIAQDLRARQSYDVAAFSAIQADVTSLAERDLARAAAAAIARRAAAGDDEVKRAGAALAAFDGRFVESSQAAVYVWALRRAAGDRLVRYHMPPDLGRRYIAENTGLLLVTLSRALRERPRGWVPGDDFDAFLTGSMRDALDALKKDGKIDATWDAIGARTAEHPLGSFGLTAFNGVRFPGHGDPFTPHAQGTSVTQSFRAVWDVGNWDAAGIVIPQGESGSPGSQHYRDGAPVWLAGTLVPLPFGRDAVARATRTSLTLTR